MTDQDRVREIEDRYHISRYHNDHDTRPIVWRDDLDYLIQRLKELEGENEVLNVENKASRLKLDNAIDTNIRRNKIIKAIGCGDYENLQSQLTAANKVVEAAKKTRQPPYSSTKLYLLDEAIKQHTAEKSSG